MSYRVGTAEGWLYLPLAIGGYLDAACFNEIRLAVNERCTFLNALNGYTEVDPEYITGLSEFLGVIAQDNTVRGYADADYITAAWFNTTRAKIEELIPFFYDPESSGAPALYTVLDLLPNGWEKVPDNIDQYFSEAGQNRGYDPGGAGTAYGAVVGVVAAGYATADYIWTEYFNQMRSVLNQLVWTARPQQFGADRTGTYDNIYKTGFGSSAVSGALAVDDWWADVNAATAVPVDYAGYSQGCSFTYYKDAISGVYIIGITPPGAGKIDRSWWRFEWPVTNEIKAIRPRMYLLSYYGLGTTYAWNSYQIALTWVPTVPDTWAAADWDSGNAIGNSEAITSKYASEPGEPLWIGTFQLPADEKMTRVADIFGDNKYYFYYQVRNKETEPTELDDNDLWPASSAVAISRAWLHYEEPPTQLLTLVRVAFEYDSDTPI